MALAHSPKLLNFNTISLRKNATLTDKFNDSDNARKDAVDELGELRRKTREREVRYTHTHAHTHTHTPPHRLRNAGHMPEIPS